MRYCSEVNQNVIVFFFKKEEVESLGKGRNERELEWGGKFF